LGNYDPTIDVTDISSIPEDQFYENVYTASDNNGDTITWSYDDNADWLSWGTDNHTLYGKPTNADVGTYWVRVNVSDGLGGYTEHYFILNVTNVVPAMLSSDIMVANEDQYYYNDYNSDDDGFGDIVWMLKTNANWLMLDSDTGVLNGTPDNSDVGSYWVNVSVDDGSGGIAWSNFTLSIENVNDDPIIITEDVQITLEDELYRIDYNATDIDPTNDQLTWSLATNADWLTINPESGNLSGTPENSDVGNYWVNISVSDGNSGHAWSNFSLTVNNVNDDPLIITIDDQMGIVDQPYSIIYKAEDMDPTGDTLIWAMKSNATWLTINPSSGNLSGIPTTGDDGIYWVNVSVTDGLGGLNWHNFTLHIIPGEQEPPNLIPVITTINILEAQVGVKYSVDYDATDDRTPISNLTWSMETNANWLLLEVTTAHLSGTPAESDIGINWVNITVGDHEGGVGFANFTIIVKAGVVGNKEPELKNGQVSPTTGDTDTKFTFTVDYTDEDNDPGEIYVWIDGEKHRMTPEPKDKDYTDGVKYTYQTRLSKGIHKYHFTGFDGRDNAVSGDGTPINDASARDTPDVKEIEKEADGNSFFMIIIVILVIVIIIILAAVIFRRSDKLEEDQEELEDNIEELDEDMDELSKDIEQTEGGIVGVEEEQ
jgi:hypothetical protein